MSRIRICRRAAFWAQEAVRLRMVRLACLEDHCLKTRGRSFLRHCGDGGHLIYFCIIYPGPKQKNPGITQA